MIRFKIKVRKNRIESKKLNEVEGKEVEVTIREHPDKKNNGKNWKNLGTLHLSGKLDNLNIRDYAHEESTN